jgi:hypothetical protein
MDNRGKLWTIDDDQKLMEQPDFPNNYFANLMGRTENAIKCRRNHLAAKMFQNDPKNGSLEEYVLIMRADFAQTSALVEEWKQKRTSIQAFTELNRKRKLAPSAGPPPCDSSPTEHERITLLCKRICDEGGNITPMWASQEHLPLLVQYYPGFEAYAKVVQVLSASGH